MAKNLLLHFNTPLWPWRIRGNLLIILHPTQIKSRMQGSARRPNLSSLTVFTCNSPHNNTSCTVSTSTVLRISLTPTCTTAHMQRACTAF
jgi:hypothetical protein